MYPKYWLTWFGLFITFMLAYLPWWIQRALGRLLGSLAYRVKSRRKVVERNIALCFPGLDECQQKQLVKKHFIDFGISVLETCTALWCLGRIKNTQVNLVGCEHLLNIVAKGQAAILVSGHFGCMDITTLLARVWNHKAKIYWSYQANKNKLVDYFINKMRHKNRAPTIERSDMRGMVKKLQQGNIIWMAADQDVSGKTKDFAPFMGVSASAITSPSRLAKLTGAAIVPFTWYRTSNKPTYELVIQAPIENCPSDDLIADVAKINACLEAAIRKYPEQYWWIHKKFKTRPPGEPAVYN